MSWFSNNTLIPDVGGFVACLNPLYFKTAVVPSVVCGAAAGSLVYTMLDNKTVGAAREMVTGALTGGLALGVDKIFPEGTDLSAASSVILGSATGKLLADAFVPRIAADADGDGDLSTDEKVASFDHENGPLSGVSRVISALMTGIFVSLATYYSGACVFASNGGLTSVGGVTA